MILTSEEKALLEKEEQHGRKLVHWAADAGQALELAHARRKPMSFSAWENWVSRNHPTFDWGPA